MERVGPRGRFRAAGFKEGEGPDVVGYGATEDSRLGGQKTGKAR